MSGVDFFSRSQRSPLLFLGQAAPWIFGIGCAAAFSLAFAYNCLLWLSIKSPVAGVLCYFGAMLAVLVGSVGLVLYLAIPWLVSRVYHPNDYYAVLIGYHPEAIAGDTNFIVRTCRSIAEKRLSWSNRCDYLELLLETRRQLRLFDSYSNICAASSFRAADLSSTS